MAIGSGSKGVDWREPADEDEVAEAATRTDARCEGFVSVLISGRRGRGLRWKRDGRGGALELEEKAGLGSAVTSGRVPEAGISDLVQPGGKDVLEETAEELVAVHAAGSPAG